MNKNHQIHSTAIIHPEAVIGKNVTIEAYAVIHSPHVVLEDNVVIKSHAYIDGRTTIGEGTVIYPGASIGTKAQDLKFRGEQTFVKIGQHCEIREFVTINSSCQENSSVEVGNNCLFMAYCHVAHNCKVGNGVIMSNNAALAGHVEVEDYAIIGGYTPIHQFVRVGAHAMIGGMSRVTHDILPYTIGAGIPFKVGGLNIIGLKRRGFPLEVRQALSKAFKLIYRSGMYLEDAIRKIEAEVTPFAEIQNLVQFCKGSKRGLIGLQGIAKDPEDGNEENEEG